MAFRANMMSGIGADSHLLPSISTGANNFFMHGSSMSYGGASAWGAGIGAGLGGINGGMSYDGSAFSGAMNGAILGGIGGAAFRGASGSYAKGGGAFGQNLKMGAFSDGFFAPKVTP